MRASLATVLAAILTLSSPALAQMAPTWAPSVDAARQAAGQTNRLVLLYFCGDRCGACRELEQTVLSQPQVMGQIVANYVPVKLNADQNARLAMNCQVNALPTVVVTTVDGQIVDRIVGKKPAAEFMGLLGQIAAKAPRTPPTTTLAGTPASSSRLPGGGQLGGGTAPGLSVPATPGAGMTPGGPATAAPGLPPSAAPERPPVSQDNITDAIAEYNASRQSAISAQSAASRVTDPTPTMPALSRPQPAVGAAVNDPLAGTPSTGSPVSRGAAPALTTPSPMAPPTLPGGSSTKPTMPAPGLMGVPASALPGSTASAAAPPSVAQPRMPPGVPPLALDGCCPVTMIEKNDWKPGDVRYGAIHEGRTYLFAGPEEQRKFLANFNAYAPVLGGRDIVAAAEKGDAVIGVRQYGAVIFDRVYLFSSEASRQRFMANPAPYIHWATTTANRSSSLPGALR